MTQIVTANRKKVVVCSILVFVAMMLLAGGVATAQEMDEEFMAIMEHIAEDIEEIHEDMHKVVSHLRTISYAGIGIFLVLLAQALIMLRK